MALNLQKSSFQNGGTIQDGGFLTFNFQKFGKNQ
jgi:hypothetical protein